MVSFTGKLDVNLMLRLRGGGSLQAAEVKGEAKEESASESGEGQPEPSRKLTLIAQRARERLRYAQHLRRMHAQGHRTLEDWEKEELALLDSDVLRTRANEATRRSGFGRIHNIDGSYVDINAHGRGIVRTLVDDVMPNLDNEPDLYIS